MIKGQAIRPEFFNNLPTVIKEKQAKALGVSDEEMQLYSLSQTKGWQILEEYIEGLLKDLETSAMMAMAQGLPFDEIGKNMVIASNTRGIVERIIEKVQDAKEVCEKEDGTIK